MAILKYLGMLLYAARAARSRTSRRCWTRRPSSATRCRPIHRFARRRCLATRRRASASKVPRTTGGARSATRTTTVRRILMMSAATRTGESNPRTSRYIRSLRGPIPSPLLSSSFLPASHMVTKTESTHRSMPPARPSPRTNQPIKQNKVN